MGFEKNHTRPAQLAFTVRTVGWAYNTSSDTSGAMAAVAHPAIIEDAK
jgi:hypothetical protein